MKRHRTARSKASHKEQGKQHAIVEACSIYAANIAASNAAFTAKPDKVSDTEPSDRLVVRLSDKHLRIARARLRFIATAQATSIDALEAKARIAPVILACSGSSEQFGANLETDEATAIRVFADDVKRFIGAVRSTGLKAPELQSAKA